MILVTDSNDGIGWAEDDDVNCRNNGCESHVWK